MSDEDRIGFFGELNPFSNFHPSAFVVDGLEYHSSEQFVQATKAEYFGDNIAKERILRCRDTMDSKEICMDITNFNKREWNRYQGKVFSKPWPNGSTAQHQNQEMS